MGPAGSVSWCLVGFMQGSHVGVSHMHYACSMCMVACMAQAYVYGYTCIIDIFVFLWPWC